MTPLKIAAVTFALSGLVCAIVAARYWLRASRVYPAELAQSVTDATELHIQSTNVAIGDAGILNAKAAIWTGVAAVLSAIGSVLGVL
jgi:hypothetical protein